MIGDLKEVRYDLYCKTCKHKNAAESSDPCHECLNEPGNVDSHKPVKYESN